MANKCRVPRNDINSAPNQAELIEFAKKQLIPSLKAIYNNKEYRNNGVIKPDAIRRATINFLKSLGEGYYSSEYTYLVEALHYSLDRPSNKIFKQILPSQNLIQFLKATKTAESPSDRLSTDQIMEDDSTDTDAVDYFLNNAYNQAILAKKQLLRKMNNIVLNSFIINRQKGYIVSRIDDALNNVETYKKQLFSDIYNYFQFIGVDLPISERDLMTRSVQDLIQLCKFEISKELQVGLFTGGDLQKMYDNAYNRTYPAEEIENIAKQNEDKLKLQAYGSWLALNHFDNFIKMTVGDTIIVNPSDPKRYSYASKGTNINTTWRKDDNIDLEAEINKLTQALINTSPLMKFGSSNGIEGAYMQFSDFSYITSKIKDLVYQDEASNIIMKDGNVVFDQLLDDEKSLVKNKSLRQIISHSRYNPQKYTPIVYKILTTAYTDAATGNPMYLINDFSNFNTQDKNLLWTIYKNIYDESYIDDDTSIHSLYAIQNRNQDSKNYYAAVSSVSDCIFSVDFAQYVFDDGVLKLRTLRDAAIDKTKNEIARIINTRNGSELVKDFDFSSYDIKEIKSENKLIGISFKLELEPGKSLYVHVKNMGEQITFSENPNHDGAPLNNIQERLLFNNVTINNFIDEVLGLNLSGNPDFRNTYQELIEENGDRTGPYVKQVLGLSSQVFFNRYFSQKYLDSKRTRYDKNSVIKQYFTDEKTAPKFNNQTFTMEMIPNSKYNIILKLAQALGTTRGLNSSRQVKDSDNAMLSSQTLSRLLGNMVQQLDVQIASYNKLKDLRNQIADKQKVINDPRTIEARKNILRQDIEELQKEIEELRTGSYILDNGQNPAAANFSIITNSKLFKGVLKSEEIKGIYGNKKQVKFTTAEALMSSFLHNFVLGHCRKDDLPANSELGDGIVGLLPSVNSDKTTVSIAKFDLKALVRPGSNITYEMLDNPAIMELIREEIGNFYNVMYDNVKSDFKRLGDLHGININPDDGFAELNLYVDLERSKGNNVTASEVLFDWTNEYNSKHPGNPIRLIDQIHYIVDGNYIKFNNTISTLKNRFSSSEATQEFFKLKSTEVLKSSLDSEFVLSLYGNKNLDKQPEIAYLRGEKYENWVNKSGQMVMAKAVIDGVEYNITTKADLSAIEDALTISKMKAAGVADAENLYRRNPGKHKIMYGYDKLSNKIHLLKDVIKLHPMMEKYNLMDYLFTQQLMYSTVGSHVAHPAKGKFDVLATITKLEKDLSYTSSEGITTKIEFVDHLDTTKNKPVAARSTVNEQGERVIQLNKVLLRQKFLEKAWTQPAILEDGTQATPLKESEFKTFDGFLTFVLEHESAHVTNLIQEGETRGQYETRINNIALNSIKTKIVPKYKQQSLAEEASRFYAQHKRNVSFTAAMDQFQLNQIDGIPLWYNISIIDDIKEELFTIDGNTDSAKPYDGATYVNPIIMYLENNSLNEARAGIDKKQFVHYYDEMTGSGGIIKTAGFAVTNDRMRNSVFYRHMMHNMTNKVWKDYQGNDYVADITKNYKGEDVTYDKFYYKQGKKYYEASIQKATVGLIRQLNLTTSSGIENDPSIPDDADLPNGYIKLVTEVTQDGSAVSESQYTLEEDINTNYKLWQMFGGMHSQVMNGGQLEPSETSLQLVTKAVINTGKVKPKGLNIDGTIKTDITAEHIDQPLKNADIHYMPTIGAVKQGAANMNPKAYYKGKNQLNFFRIRMTNAGIQLDKEHHADNSTLSLMTQVISSACSMGYTPKQAQKLYKALYNLTTQGIKEFKDGFREILNSKNPEKFETAIADCMIKSMLTSSAQDGDMLRAIAHDLIEQARKGKELTFEDTKGFPYSDPAIFNKLVTTLSVMMTKAGIKAKMNGILSVLCPTNGIVKMYEFQDEQGVRHSLTLSQLEEMFGDEYDKIIDKVQNMQTKHPADTMDLTNIEVGKKYIVKYKDAELEDGTTIPGGQYIFDIKYPHDTGNVEIFKEQQTIGYKTLKNLINAGQIEYVQEYVKDGKELGSINYKFVGSDGNKYQIWDIDYIQDLFKTMKAVSKAETDEEKLNLYYQLISEYDDLENFKSACQRHFSSYMNGGNTSTKHMLKLAKLYTKQLQQQILFSLSKNNPDKVNQVRIDGNYVTIDKNSIEVQPYEIVMPKIFLEEFGLDQYANLDEIVNNKNYFYDRMIRNFGTKIYDETLYDVELKRTNGNHIYIKDKSGAQTDWNQNLDKVIIHKKRDELGKLWRIDLATNKKMYQLFSDSDEVYRVPGTDIEIIATSNKIEVEQEVGQEEKRTFDAGITFYLNNFKYQSIHISDAVAAGKEDMFSPRTRPLFDNFMEMIAASKNKCAQSWIKLFTGDTDKDVDANKHGWTKDRIEFNKELNDFSQLGHRLQGYLKEQALNMHTSLLKSLDIIAARIPAQNQQSFMPMKVVAWENPNVNTAYVSVMQFFLQGSDLDIDAVSLLTHSFSKSGQFHEWSSDFNMENKELLDASLNLPFPTGQELHIIAYDKQEKETTLSNRKPRITDNEDYKWLIQRDKDRDQYKGVKLTPEQIQAVEQEELQLQKEEMQRYARLLEFIEDFGGVIYFNTEEESQSEDAQNLINRINKHNTYLNGVSDDVIVGAIKNYLVSQLYSISTDSANLLEAHTGVDVATGPLKKIANASELSEVQKTFTPGNVWNKFQAIEEASVGKDDIAICATGLKAFFAATQHCNSYLNKKIQNINMKAQDVDNLASIIRFNEVIIGGRRFSTLANIRVDDLSKVNPNSEIYRLLLDKGFDEDASVIMSALLSLSTDNAKELCLAKINAGTGMIGMYLYGAAIGMDFEVLNSIIASPLGFTVAKLLNSNEFTLKKGKTTIDSALSYLYEGPSKNDLAKFEQALINDSNVYQTSTFTILDNVLKDMVKSLAGSEMDTLIKEAIGEKATLTHKNIGKLIAYVSREKGQFVITDFLQQVNEKVNAAITTASRSYSKGSTKIENFKAINNQLHDFLVDFASQAVALQQTNYLTPYGSSNLVADLNKLALGADEFKRLGQFLRLNQEIKTKPDELIDFVQKIETCIGDRIKLINRVNKRLNKDVSLSEIQQFDFLEFAKSFVNDPNNPEAYHNKQIALYEKYCKTCINPLRVLTTVDHYKGYLESMIMAYYGDYSKSIKFRAIKQLGNAFIKEYKVGSKAEKSAVIKGVQNFVDDYINTAYLRSEPLLKLPPTTKTRKVQIIDADGEGHDVTAGTHISLGTVGSNKTFEHFFENIFIPALKNAEQGNEFVDSIQQVLVTDPNTGASYLATSLPINMMPTSDNERALFNVYKNAFTRLDGGSIKIGNVNYNIIQMFHYYNLLKFKGKSGRSSLLHMFEDIMNHDTLKNYRRFINNFDSTYDFTTSSASDKTVNDDNRTYIKVDKAVLDMYLAPLSNPFSSTSKLIKYKDLNKGETVLLIKQEERKNVPVEGDEEFGDYFDTPEEEFDDPTIMGFEEEFYIGNNESNYGNYEQKKGNLKRFDPNVQEVFNSNEQIIDSIKIDGTLVKDIAITNGCIKSLTINGQKLQINSNVPAMTIIVEEGKPDTYTLDEETLKEIINQKLNCGK